jgi:hypothetical protein
VAEGRTSISKKVEVKHGSHSAGKKAGTGKKGWQDEAVRTATLNAPWGIAINSAGGALEGRAASFREIENAGRGRKCVFVASAGSRLALATHSNCRAGGRFGDFYSATENYGADPGVLGGPGAREKHSHPRSVPVDGGGNDSHDRIRKIPMASTGLVADGSGNAGKARGAVSAPAGSGAKAPSGGV